MKSELYEALRLYGAMYPDKLETLTEKEFWMMKEQEKRRREDGNFRNGRMYCQCAGALRV
ncbi:MAG: hypothetical protein HFI19_11640 [Lachnospiraceae bacterium]|jgi:hypothetical protein|uniref:hypothetical protein n=1 Tax=Candidatus Merdisoma sp. JLR.KK006 TaxID=3112626 RepID=UPI002FEF7AFA|nr:hypothetical protein [Lachnospiraceae bacterium]